MRRLVVSVVIPTRNRLAYLREAVGSVKRQTASMWELIVVDDDSSDGTREWLRSIEAPNIRLIELEGHCERSAARNLGLRMSEGESVLFLDDDDRLTPNALRRLSEELEGESEAVAAVGGMVRFDQRGPFKLGAHTHRRINRDVWTDVLVGWVGTTGRSLIRKAALERIGGFNEEMVFGEDWETWLRLSCQGSVVLIPDVVLEYRVHSGQSEEPGWMEARTGYIERHLRGLPPGRQIRGLRTLESWTHHAAGIDALAHDDPRRALVHFARGLRSNPSIYASPLQRRRMRYPLLKALIGAPLGRRGMRALRRVLPARSQ